MSNCKLVSVDGLVLSVHCPVTDNTYIPENTGSGDTRLYHVAYFDVGGSDTSLFRDILNSFRLESDHSVEEATARIFRLGDIHVFSHLK